MSSFVQPSVKAFSAGADLTAKQYHFVKFGSSDLAVVSCSVAAEVGIGVLLNKPNIGEDAEVALLGGGGLIKLAGTVTRGQLIATNNAGAGLAATSGQFAFGVALASGVSGDVISILLIANRG